MDAVHVQYSLALQRRVFNIHISCNNSMPTNLLSIAFAWKRRQTRKSDGIIVEVSGYDANWYQNSDDSCKSNIKATWERSKYYPKRGTRG
jgi:hypothetical protein